MLNNTRVSLFLFFFTMVFISNVNSVFSYDGPYICDITPDKNVDQFIEILSGGKSLNEEQITIVLNNLPYFLKRLHDLSEDGDVGLSAAKKALKFYFDSGDGEGINPRDFIDEHHTYNSRYMTAVCNLSFINSILRLSDIEVYANLCRKMGNKGYYCPFDESKN